jgi:hypothetical protein
MQTRTVNLILTAPARGVFPFLAQLENLPAWATEFCSRVYQTAGRWKAVTSQGELFCEAEASAATGVIDLRIGPAPDQLGLFPLRVLSPAPGLTAVQFTFFQPPGLPDELYEKQYRSLLVEMRGLAHRFGGGTLHPAGGPAETIQATRS